MGAVVREPTLADVEALARLHVRAWQAAYRGVMPDAFLDGLRWEGRAEMWTRVIESGRGGLLVTTGVTGFVSFGAGEVMALNVDPPAWGTGAGGALLTSACNGLAEAGASSAFLWVVQKNANVARPRLRALFTAPVEMPRSMAMAATERSSTWCSAKTRAC
jgi:N-acetylglutamate synthase-like GNAT family acetyltransferase